LIGEVFDQRYKIERLLGEGGMGAVYEAVDSTTSGRVAVKVITANVSKNTNLVARFQREARAAAKIATDEIVQVLETGTDPKSGLPYMVMEYLEGEDLAQVFKRLGKLPVNLALRLGAQACMGLEKAHAARVIHRDIKPANLFLAKGAGTARKLKLLDFGVAKIKLESVSGVDTSGLTRTGSMLGSPLYMSPEQARGQKLIDARADIWSLGVVMYQALTGRRPHQDIDGLGELIIAICSELPAPLQDYAPWVPADVAAIVHGALQFNPDDRFPTAQAMFEVIVKQLGTSDYSIDESMLLSLTAEQRAVVVPRLSSVELNAPQRYGTRAVVRPPMSMDEVDDAAATLVFDPPPTEAAPQKPRPREAPGFATAKTVPIPPMAVIPPPAQAPPPPPAIATVIVPTAPVITKAPSSPPPAAVETPSPLVALPSGSPTALTSPPDPRATVARTARVNPAARARSTATIAVALAAFVGLGAVGAFMLRDPGGAAKTVEVQISPADAIVEIDGAKATVKNGAVTVTGTLGSLHKVKITVAGHESVEQVAITDKGALPAKITGK
jgi:serine/threonine-protein kinase